MRREQGRLDELEPGMRADADRYPGAVGFRCALAYVLVELNRQAEARTEFERLAADDFAVLRKEAASLNVALLAQVCASLGDAQRAQTLYELLLPYAGRNLVAPFTFVCFGSASHPLALLAATMQCWEEATRHFEDALRMYRKMGAPLFMARTQFEYARMLLGRNEPGDHEKAHELLTQALTTAHQLGMKSIEERVSALLSPASSSKESVQQSALSNQQVASSKQRRETRDPRPETNVFRKEADYWTITYDDVVLRVKDSKGMQYIARLLAHPGQEFHVLDLAAEESGTGGRDQGPATAILDARARSEYTQRLAALRAEIEEAERHHDAGRNARLREEVHVISEQLAAAVGLGGRNRAAAQHAQRARVAVTKRIREAIERIRTGAPDLGHYLTATIKTGQFCAYIPDPRRPVTWTL